MQYDSTLMRKTYNYYRFRGTNKVRRKANYYIPAGMHGKYYDKRIRDPQAIPDSDFKKKTVTDDLDLLLESNLF